MAELSYSANPLGRIVHGLRLFVRTLPAQLFFVLIAGLLFGAGLLGAFLGRDMIPFVAAWFGALGVVLSPWAIALLFVAMLQLARGKDGIAWSIAATPAVGVYGFLMQVVVAVLIIGLFAITALVGKLLGALALVLAVAGVVAGALVIGRLAMGSVIVVAEGASPLRALRLAWQRLSWGGALRLIGNLLLQQLSFGLIGTFLFYLLGGAAVVGMMAAMLSPVPSAATPVSLAGIGLAILMWVLFAILAAFLTLFLNLATLAMFYQETGGKPASQPPAYGKGVWVVFAILVLASAGLSALGVSTAPSQQKQTVFQFPQAPAARPKPSLPSAQPDAAQWRMKAWQAWRRGDAVSVLRAIRKSRGSRRDSVLARYHGAQKARMQRKIEAWNYAMEAWAWHRLGQEENARRALVQACALQHAPSCAVLEALP